MSHLLLSIFLQHPLNIVISTKKKIFQIRPWSIASESAIFPKTFPICHPIQSRQTGIGQIQKSIPRRRIYPFEPKLVNNPSFYLPSKRIFPLARNFNKFHESPSKSHRGKLERPLPSDPLIGNSFRRYVGRRTSLIYRGDNLRVTSPPRWKGRDASKFASRHQKANYVRSSRGITE